jgi:ATP-dependent Lon protease|tara:strand:- start:887 stop:1354 length:468 start_codon:yes stop_codon:yes gene_type:complete
MSTKTIKRVLDKLERTTKLSAVKTELSAVDDLQEANIELTNILTNLATEPDFPQMASKLRSTIDNVVEEANAFIILYDILEEVSDELNTSITNLQNAISTYEDLSDEIGLDTSASEDYTKSVRLIEDAVATQNVLDNLLVKFGELYDTADRILTF